MGPSRAVAGFLLLFAKPSRPRDQCLGCAGFLRRTSSNQSIPPLGFLFSDDCFLAMLIGLWTRPQSHRRTN